MENLTGTACSSGLETVPCNPTKPMPMPADLIQSCSGGCLVIPCMDFQNISDPLKQLLSALGPAAPIYVVNMALLSSSTTLGSQLAPVQDISVNEAKESVASIDNSVHSSTASSFGGYNNCGSVEDAMEMGTNVGEDEVFEGSFEDHLLKDGSWRMDDEHSRKKKFLFRLLLALHASEFIRDVAIVYGLHCTVSVLPTTAVFTFHLSSSRLSPHTSESYSLRIGAGYHYHRLRELDLLISRICNDNDKDGEGGEGSLSLAAAEKALHTIETGIGSFGWRLMLPANMIMSGSCATMFFGGSWTDGALACCWGAVLYAMSCLCERHHGLSEIENFLTSFLITVVSSLTYRYGHRGDDMCLYAQVFGGIVFLLPGWSITIGMLEIYSRMTVYGTARLMQGISTALQIGFGITFGYGLVYGSGDIVNDFKNGCPAPINAYWNFLLLPMLAISLCITIQCQSIQLPGMILCCAVAEIASYYLSTVASAMGGAAVVPLLSSVCVTVAARFVGNIRRERPYCYIIVGLVLLVPGSVSVKGMTEMWAGNTGNGLAFTFKMLMIGISLAIGVFIGLVAIPPYRFAPEVARLPFHVTARLSKKG